MKQKNFLKILLFQFVITSTFFAQNNNGSIDAAGDIAIVAMNKVNSPASKSDFAFVLLDDCTTGTSIIFDDDEWEGSDWASTTGEGAVTWTNNTGRTLGVGTVIQIESGNDSPTVNLGIATESDLGFNLSDDDQLYAYVGTFRSTGVTFLTFRGDLAINTATLSGTGLTSGTNALDTTNPLGYYSGSVVCNSTLSDCGSNINSEGTWTDGIFTWPTGVASYFNGSALPITWNGTISSDWATTSNWSNNATQDSNSHITISSGLTNYPTVTTAETINSLSIASGATLIATNAGFSVTNNATYVRNLATGSRWYLMSSPVVGENYNNTWVTDNSIPSSTQDTDNRGISWYNNASSDTDSDGAATGDSATGFWRYMEAGNDNSFTVGRGYGIIRSSSGDITFTGTGIYTSDQTYLLEQGVNNFNLIGNPFTSFITLGTFHTTNSGVIGTTFYTWNGSSYTTRLSNISDSDNQNYEIAPGQGFFVEASSESNVTFEVSDVSHQSTDTFEKNSNTISQVKLNINEGNNERFAKIYYIDGTTTGFDNGYDGKLFGGVSHSLAIFSNLVDNSNTEKYQIQSLPNSDHENMVVPFGVIAAAGKEITFTAEALNLPTGLKVYLEDREKNAVTRLDEANSNYKVTLNTALNGTGRFFLHTRSSALSTGDIALEGANIYQLNKNSLRVSGINSDNARIKIYSILGKQVLDHSFSSKGNSDITLPNLNTGVYIVQVATEKGKINKKIVLK